MVFTQVRKRPLNKKEISKKEEDIITIEPYSSSLTVHETKLKVRVQELILCGFFALSSPKCLCSHHDFFAIC